MKKVIFFIIFLILFLRSSAAEERKNILLIFIGQNVESINAYVSDVGHVPDGFMAYTSIQNLEGLDSPSNVGSGVQYAQALIDQYPHAQIQIGFYIVGALREILDEKYDKNISKLASWFKKNSKTKFYLRIGYEFDNPENHYEPLAYIQAYRYIVNRLRKLGVNNVLYVWHSYGGFVTGDVERWYPGDDYVDWVGISFFDAFSQGNMRRIVNIAQKHNKPVMIAEATPLGVGVEQGEKSWKFWYQRLFDFVDQNNIAMICYINWDWEKIPMFKGQGWGNGQIQDNEIIKNKWLDKIFEK
ncbi:MAG: glycosyl hydrolase [Candidatus Omnitrophica bacterium]|nr:glycosyl hydrolase [Candidatus Omnitrophota bacterium]